MTMPLISRMRLATLCGLVLSTPIYSHAGELIRLHGSNTIGAQLAPAMAQQFLRQAYQAREVAQQETAEAQNETRIMGKGEGKTPLSFDIQAHGSGTAFADLLTGQADIGMASRVIKQSEREALNEQGDFVSMAGEYVIGLDGIAVIVHKRNPLRSLKVEQIRDIFSGQIHHWGELGISLGPIKVYARDDKSGTYDTFKHLVLDKQHPLSPRAQRYESNTRLSDDVAADPDAIGFVGLPYIRSAKALSVARGSGAALYPSKFNVATEDYPLSRRLFFYIAPNNANHLQRSFVNYAVSFEGQKVVEHSGFVSLNIYSEAPNLNAQQLLDEEFTRLTYGAERLSVNFRFDQESNELDNRALRDVERLAGYLKRNKAVLEKVMLFGFSEDTAVPIFNIALSEYRAEAVQRALYKQGVDVHHLRGFGSEQLLDERSSRERNRRVEVWIKRRDSSAAISSR